MSERGVFAMDRGWFCHPVFADEPYTEREAWAWLISEAAWKARTRRIGDFIINLERGQVAASLRFMADAWKWHYSKVKRFLDKLKTETMIETDVKHGVSVITIRNYNKFQRVSLPDATDIETPNATGPQQVRNKTEDIKYIKLAAAEVSASPLIRKSAFEVAEKVAVLCGHDPQFIPPEWCEGPMTAERWLAHGWQPEMIVLAVESILARRGSPPNRMSYFEKPIAEFIAKQARPMPHVVINNTPEIVNVRTEATGSLVSATDRILERMRQLDEPAGSGEGGGSPIRLLPPIGRG